MALDPNIILQAKPVQFDNPLNALAQYSQIQNAQSQNKLADLKLEEAQRGLTQKNALSEAYKAAVKPDGTVDRTALFTGLAQGGLGAEIPGIQKGYAEQDKSASETQKASLEQAIAKQKIVAQYAGAARDQSSWSQGIQSLQSMGIDVSNVPQQYDPQTAAVLRDRALTGSEQLQQKWNEMKYTTPTADALLSSQTSRANTAANNATSIATNANTVNATIRGQDKGQIVQSDSGPVLVDPRTGAGRVVTGSDGNALPGVSKPLNDGQSKALLFGTRMQEANKVLAQLEGEKTTTSVPGSRAPGIGPVINAFSSGNQQMLDQAKRDFMTAVLRRESGAAISNGEFDTADKQYFPQPGDSDKVIAQKARNRELAINGVLIEVPEKQRASITPKSTVTPAQQVKAAVDNGESARIGRAKPPSVSTAADYNRLPSGTVYMAPDGSMRTKQ